MFCDFVPSLKTKRARLTNYRILKVLLLPIKNVKKLASSYLSAFPIYTKQVISLIADQCEDWTHNYVSRLTYFIAFLSFSYDTSKQRLSLSFKFFYQLWNRCFSDICFVHFDILVNVLKELFIDKVTEFQGIVERVVTHQDFFNTCFGLFLSGFWIDVGWHCRVATQKRLIIIDKLLEKILYLIHSEHFWLILIKSNHKLTSL